VTSHARASPIFSVARNAPPNLSLPSSPTPQQELRTLHTTLEHLGNGISLLRGAKGGGDATRFEPGLTQKLDQLRKGGRGELLAAL